MNAQQYLEHWEQGERKEHSPLPPVSVLGAWVDVNERRPEKMGYVICACEGGNVDKSFYDPTANLAELGLGRKFAGKWGRYFELSKMGYKITHWMPMPKAPNAAMSDADTKP